MASIPARTPRPTLPVFPSHPANAASLPDKNQFPGNPGQHAQIVRLAAENQHRPGRPSQPLLRSRQRGKRNQGSAITRWAWNTNIPLTRHLPGLLPVITGHLCMVGVRPRLASSNSPRDVDAPAGLRGPALLDMDTEATEEEIALGETIYASRCGLTARMGYLARGAATLFRRRAWQSSAR